MSENQENAALKEAREKIEEARRTGARHLSLIGMGLTELPESIAQLSPLENLDLSENQLAALPESIAQLSQLKELRLRSNQLTALPESIAQLSRLETLDLSVNRFTALPKSIGQLSQLKEINLSGNQLTALSEFIAQLSRLETLYLSGNQLTPLPDSIAQLSRLRLLGIGGNQLTALPESIGQLSQLAGLDISNSQLTALPESIGQLSQLELLYLDNNQLNALPESIGQLSQLRALYLSNNQLTALPESIGKLSQLETIDLIGNRLTGLPESIAQLSQLERLDLRINHLTALPESIGQLSQLKILSVTSNLLTALPDSIAQLSRLSHLGLGGNRLTTLPESIGQLARLETLNLSVNQLTALPEPIAQLSQLKDLDLSGNELTALPESIAQLSKLKMLDLCNNQLQALPEQLTQLPHLEALFLHGNPALKIPAEILGPPAGEVGGTTKPKPPREILAYLFQAAIDSQPLNEAKLILVGHGAVGKTSLVKALATGKFNKSEKTTEGIKINDWACALNRKEEVTVHIWDFGGQEMMHATHQFFLTRRSLYLLVLNRRTGGVDREADYWFRMIRAFGGTDAPVIVVLNKQKFEPFDVNREGWFEKYKGNIKGFVSTDCEDKKSISELKRMITVELQAMESLKARFPRRWFAIKNALSQMEAEHISFDHYRELCQKHGETNAASQTMLAGFLHDLGIALNYQEDHRLSFNYVLKPEWVTKGIYALLHAFVDSKGVFTHAEAADQLAKIKYSAEDTRFILNLMERFDLCFPLGDRQNRVLIPELLDDRQPKEVAGFKLAECLNFGYEYSILPEGLLPRFIARTHHLGQPETRWKSGVILTDEGSGCRALVRADTADAQVRVNIDGPAASRPELLGIVRYNLEVIHRDYKLQPRALVYAPGEPEKAFSLEELEELSRQRRETVEALLPNKKIINPRIVDLVTPAQSAPAQVTLFLSYSHKDEKYVEELRKRLRPMERNGTLRTWYDRKLTAGERWKDEILRELKSADIVVCQLSPDFLDSDFCVLTELDEAVRRQEAGDAVMVAYVLRVCGWKDEPRLAPFQLLPHDGRELRGWKDKDKFWQAVADGIKETARKLQAKRKERGGRSRMDV